MSIFSQEELSRSPKDDGFFEGADLLPFNVPCLVWCAANFL